MTIIVCINAHPKSKELLLTASTKAKALGCDWNALYIETPAHYAASASARERIIKFMAIAEEMGGSVIQLEARNAFEGIYAYITQHHEVIKHVIFGKQVHVTGLHRFKRSLVQKITKKILHMPIEVHLVSLPEHNWSPPWYERLQLKTLHFEDIAFAVLCVVFAFGCVEAMQHLMSDSQWRANSQNITAFFMLACTVASLRCGLIPGLLSALVSFMTIDFFYTKPYMALSMDNGADGIALTVFMVTAVIVSLVGAYTRSNRAALIRKEKRSQALFTLYKSATYAGTRLEALKIMHKELCELLEMDVAFFLPPLDNSDHVSLAYPKDVQLSEKDGDSLQFSWKKMQASGLGTRKHIRSSWRFEPILSVSGEIGVVGFRVEKYMALDAGFGRLVAALADQIGGILERIDLTQEMNQSHVREEREKLRAMLLSSVSHDLKTPLASIIGSMSVYQRLTKSGRLSDEIALELTDTTLEEAHRLDSFISNILEMTRIESGDITFKQEWVHADAPITSVRKRLKQRTSGHNVICDKNEEPYEIKVDSLMLEQVLQNVVDNAAKYSPKGKDIFLSYGIRDNIFFYEVCDQGNGIPDDKLESIFDKYERLKQTDSQVAGTGLGLAISKAIMNKMGGDITAGNHPEHGGAIFTMTLPLYRKASQEERKKSRYILEASS